jgi:coenzyme F420-reducing hydrogenase delta subunit
MLGFEKARIRQEFISAAEFPKFARVVNEMVAEVRKLGRSPLAQSRDLRPVEENAGLVVINQ